MFSKKDMLRCFRWHGAVIKPCDEHCPVREFRQRGFEGRDVLIGKQQFVGGVHAEVFRGDGGPVVRQQAAKDRNMRIVEDHLDARGDHMFACGQGFEAQFDHALICPDEAPRSELDAAEIAGHDRGKLTDPAVQQHGEHGAARRAVRFAVVVAGLAGRAGGVSPAIVGRVGEFLFDPLDEGFGRLRGRRMGKADDEPAAADDFFAAVQVFWGQIRDEIGDRHGNKV